MMKKHIYGPIRSRRLGRSLGVNLITPKTCPLDCIYCEARATTNLTMERKEYVCIDEVLTELTDFLPTIELPDYITFSGSGEPTLNSGLGKVLNWLKTHYPAAKVCLLTNGLLLDDVSLQKELAQLDLIIPSLDASNENEYQQINHPIPGETLEKLVEKIAGFRKNVPVKMALEIFIAPGINDSPESIERFAGIVKRIAPDEIQLNTLDRPGIVDDLVPASPETISRFADVLQNIAPITFRNDRSAK